jgi:hypothetical protein
MDRCLGIRLSKSDPKLSVFVNLFNEMVYKNKAVLYYNTKYLDYD